ncbi:MAG: hypothetical protein ACLFTK_11580 [Anaerolineales bacterium]
MLTKPNLSLDPAPDDSNRIAWALGYILHPFVLFPPSAALTLRHEPPLHSLGWIALIGAMTMLPTGIVMIWQQRRGKFLWQRSSRLPVYIVGWICGVWCLLKLLALGAPERIIVCNVAMLVWVPAQAFINQRYTKISGHAASSMGVAVGLGMLGELNSPPMALTAILVVGLTAWARRVTKNHTPQQIWLGWLVAGLTVGGTFALLL